VGNPVWQEHRAQFTPSPRTISRANVLLGYTWEGLRGADVIIDFHNRY
jgi:hypothetical protein